VCPPLQKKDVIHGVVDNDVDPVDVDVSPVGMDITPVDVDVGDLDAVLPANGDEDNQKTVVRRSSRVKRGCLIGIRWSGRWLPRGHVSSQEIAASREGRKGIESSLHYSTTLCLAH
jgi:hypothetical protein